MKMTMDHVNGGGGKQYGVVSPNMGIYEGLVRLVADEVLQTWSCELIVRNAFKRFNFEEHVDVFNTPFYGHVLHAIQGTHLFPLSVDGAHKTPLDRMMRDDDDDDYATTVPSFADGQSEILRRLANIEHLM